jgi:hypothetical protein
MSDILSNVDMVVGYNANSEPVGSYDRELLVDMLKDGIDFMLVVRRLNDHVSTSIDDIKDEFGDAGPLSTIGVSEQYNDDLDGTVRAIYRIKQGNTYRVPLPLPVSAVYAYDAGVAVDKALRMAAEVTAAVS